MELLPLKTLINGRYLFIYFKYKNNFSLILQYRDPFKSWTRNDSSTVFSPQMNELRDMTLSSRMSDQGEEIDQMIEEGE